MRGDLHCHTKISDGSMSPEDLIKYAARIGLDCIAVTDHDSMSGIAPAQAQALNLGVTLIPGIEVSTFDYKHDKRAHLLCYMPRNPAPLLALCAQTLQSRNAASLAIIEKVAAKYPIDLAVIKKYAFPSEAIYKQHIIFALMDMGYSLSVFGELFHELFSVKSGWARVNPKYPDTRDAMKLICESGGLAVLAHPGVYGNFDIIDELCEMGLDGIETCHPRQSAEDERAAFEAASRHALLTTGGSDFHGMFSARINPLACRTAPDDCLTDLIGRLKSSN